MFFLPDGFRLTEENASNMHPYPWSVLTAALSIRPESRRLWRIESLLSVGLFIYLLTGTMTGQQPWLLAARAGNEGVEQASASNPAQDAGKTAPIVIGMMFEHWLLYPPEPVVAPAAPVVQPAPQPVRKAPAAPKAGSKK